MMEPVVVVPNQGIGVDLPEVLNAGSRQLAASAQCPLAVTNQPARNLFTAVAKRQSRPQFLPSPSSLFLFLLPLWLGVTQWIGLSLFAPQGPLIPALPWERQKILRYFHEELRIDYFLTL